MAGASPIDRKYNGAWRCRRVPAPAKQATGDAEAGAASDVREDATSARRSRRVLARDVRRQCTHGNEGTTETGDVGTDLPCAVVIVSLRRRLMERCDSARSSERKERPASTSCLLGLNVRKMASSSDFSGTPASRLNVAELTVSGRLSCVCFLGLHVRRLGDGARDEEGEASERRPEVNKGEYWANMAMLVVVVFSAVGGGIMGVVEDSGEGELQNEGRGLRLFCMVA